MDSVYLISLIVGGFFVVLSIFGGSEHEADSDVDADFDTDFDADTDVDFEADFDVDADVDHDFHIGGSDFDASTDVGFVDLFSLRALFLFAAFFGLTGSMSIQKIVTEITSPSCVPFGFRSLMPT